MSLGDTVAVYSSCCINQEPYGQRCAEDAKKFYYGLLIDRKVSPATLDNVHTVLHPAFQMGVRDGLIRVNPSEGVMAEIKKSHFWVKPKRHALTVPQQRVLTEFVTDNREFCGWYPVFIVLLGTGIRIGECLGIRWDDLDFVRSGTES